MMLRAPTSARACDSPAHRSMQILIAPTGGPGTIQTKSRRRWAPGLTARGWNRINTGILQSGHVIALYDFPR